VSAIGRGVLSKALMLSTIFLIAFAGSARAGTVLPYPPGTNDFSCQTTPAHPRPVILLEGLGGNSDAWRQFAPKLKADGYCLFTLNYGEHPLLKPIPYAIEGVIPMEQSSKELAAFIDRVLQATHTRKVDIVGHSEGTVMPRWYLERLGGRAKVQKFVALTPLWRGTQAGGLTMLDTSLRPYGLSQPIVNLIHSLCAACTEVLEGSDYLNNLNADGEAIPGIEHTNIMTKTDELVTPYTSGVMRDGGTNIVLQDVCPHDLSEHIVVAFDPNVLQLIQNALDPDHAKPVTCAY
jgi:triacylglycerol lipase